MFKYQVVLAKYQSTKTMRLSFYYSHLLVCLLCSISSFSHAATDPTYTNFLQCLTNQSTTPSDQDLTKIIFSKDNSQYTSVLQAYIRNLRFTSATTTKPVLIVTPLTPSHVSAAVICSRTLGLPLRIRSGGHDYDGLSYIDTLGTTFVILDMSNLRQITLNPTAGTAYVEAGATLGELYYKVAQEKSKNYAFPAGVCPTVGVGGHLSGGGYGNLMRKFGLSIDHVIDAQVVDYKGRILNRKSMGEDLFWALRGGGGASFGVVISFTVGLVEVPEKVTVFNVMRYQKDNATDLVYKWQFLMQDVDENLFIRLLLQPVTDPTQKGGIKTARVTFIAMFLGDSNTLLSLFNTAFPELGIKKADCLEMTWGQSVLWWANFDQNAPLETLLNRTYKADYLKRKSDYVQQPIPKAGLELLWKKLVQLNKPGMVFNSYGGKMSEIPATATAFPHRKGNLYKIQYSTSWKDAGQVADDTNMGLIRQLYSFMTPYVSKNPRGAYLNYRDIDIGVNKNGTFNEGQVYGRKYFMQNFDRLVKVKTSVDPNDFFSYEQSIPVRKL